MNIKEEKKVVYVMVDGEFDGKIPPNHSLLSFGSIAFTLGDGVIGEYYATLDTLPGATMHPDVKTFWDKHPDMYAVTRKDTRPPQEVMYEYLNHIKELGSRPVFCEYPGFIDFMWIHWYLWNFTEQCPFGFTTDTMKSYASAMLKTPFRGTAKRAMPKRWFDRSLPHNHHALDDARGQADIFIRMKCENLGIPLPDGMRGL